MRKAAEQLWIGNAFDARDLRSVLSTGISAIVDLAIDEPPITATRELLCFRVPLLDGAGNAGHSLRLAVSVTCQLLAEEVPTLIACSSGMSRSPVIAAAALAKHFNTDMAQQLTKLSHLQPCDVSPALLQDVQQAAFNQ